MVDIDWEGYLQERGETNTRVYLGELFRAADPVPTGHPGYLLWRLGDFVRALLYSELFYPSVIHYRGCLFLEHIGSFRQSKVDRLLDDHHDEKSEVESKLNSVHLSDQLAETDDFENLRRLSRRLLAKQRDAWQRWFEYLYPKVGLKIASLPTDQTESHGTTVYVEERNELGSAPDHRPDYGPASLQIGIPASCRETDATFGSLIRNYLYEVGDIPQMALYSELFCPGIGGGENEHPLTGLSPVGGDIDDRAAIDEAYESGPMVLNRDRFPNNGGVLVETLFQSSIGDQPVLRRSLGELLTTTWDAWFSEAEVILAAFDRDETAVDSSRSFGIRVSYDG